MRQGKFDRALQRQRFGRECDGQQAGQHAQQTRQGSSMTLAVIHRFTFLRTGNSRKIEELSRTMLAKNSQGNGSSGTKKSSVGVLNGSYTHRAALPIHAIQG